MKLYQEVTPGAEYPLHTYWMSADRGHIGGYIPVGGTFTVFSSPMGFYPRGRKFVEVRPPRFTGAVKAEIERMTAMMAPKTAAPTPTTVSTRTVAGSGGKVYTLTRGVRGWVCNCPGYTFRGRCKHSESIAV